MRSSARPLSPSSSEEAAVSYDLWIFTPFVVRSSEWRKFLVFLFSPSLSVSRFSLSHVATLGLGGSHKTLLSKKKTLFLIFVEGLGSGLSGFVASFPTLIDFSKLTSDVT